MISFNKNQRHAIRTKQQNWYVDKNEFHSSCLAILNLKFICVSRTNIQRQLSQIFFKSFHFFASSKLIRFSLHMLFLLPFLPFLMKTKLIF